MCVAVNNNTITDPSELNGLVIREGTRIHGYEGAPVSCLRFVIAQSSERRMGKEHCNMWPLLADLNTVNACNGK
jgi:hypothetical protein